MVEFFRDVLSGPLYVVVALLSLIFIMAIIGFIMERKKQEKDEKGRIAYVNNSIDTLPPVQTTTVSTQVPNLVTNNVNNEMPQKLEDSNPALLVKTPVVVFSDPDKKA